MRGLLPVTGLPGTDPARAGIVRVKAGCIDTVA